MGSVLNNAVDTVARQRWLDPVSKGMQAAITGAYRAGGPVGQQIKDALHGTWLGHPLHPALTDVPVGAWTAALVLDTLDGLGGREELGPGADTAVMVGLVSAGGAALAGYTDWQHAEGRAQRIGIVHGLLNTTVAVIYGGSYLMRRRGARATGRKLALLGYTIASVSAYLGGELVASEQMGVDHAAGMTLPREFTSVMPEAELPEGAPHRVEVHGVPVLLVRQNGRICALAETCSHLGGPLAEGHLENGSIVCPWHGSRFALDDGHVIDGPATFPQPSYEARVVGGRIEVRQPPTGDA